MNIHFFEPPPAQKLGGLDGAIRSLRNYLNDNGFSVQVNPSCQKDDQPGLVHFHGLWQPHFLKVSVACRRAGIPYVVSPHGMLEPWAWRRKRWKKLPYYYLFERGHLRNAAAVLATSSQEAANLSCFVPHDKIATIPLSLQDEHGPAYRAAKETLGWKRDELVLFFLSRIHPKKGLHLLLRALYAIADALPEGWRLVIIGEGEAHYVSECRKISESNPNVARHIEWKGAVWGDQKWAYFQGADLFCLPSFSENFGLVILEACQVGTRVLTTPYTPWAFLRDWQAAFLVEPEVKSIAAGLKRFLNSEQWSLDDRDRLAKRIQEQFSWKTIGRQYAELYLRLVHPSAPVSPVVRELEPKSLSDEG